MTRNTGLVLVQKTKPKIQITPRELFLKTTKIMLS